jgi:hypothetical protein
MRGSAIGSDRILPCICKAGFKGWLEPVRWPVSPLSVASTAILAAASRAKSPTRWLGLRSHSAGTVAAGHCVRRPVATPRRVYAIQPLRVRAILQRWRLASVDFPSRSRRVGTKESPISNSPAQEVIFRRGSFTRHIKAALTVRRLRHEDRPRAAPGSKVVIGTLRRFAAAPTTSSRNAVATRWPYALHRTALVWSNPDEGWGQDVSI